MMVGAYARVSTDEQKKFGLSTQQQIDDLQNWAKANNVNIYDLYVDEGKSASSLKRPELQRMISDMQAGKFNKIIFTKLDRLSRKPRDYYKFMDLIEPCGGSWQAIQEDFDTDTTNGRFLINIVMSMAEAELGKTSDRINAVFKGKRERGEVTSGSCPRGFKIENKRLVIDEDRLQEAKDIFDTCERSGTLLAGYRAMLDLGYTLSFNTYRRNLKNPLFAGRSKDGVDGYCPAIIDPKRFDRIQKMYNGQTHTAQSGRIYLFTGLLRCGVCGSSYTSAYTNGKHFYYRCSHYLRGGDCGNAYMTEKLIETSLINNLRDILNKHIVEAETKNKKENKKPANPDKVKKKIERLQEVYIDGGMDKQKYEAKKKALEDELLEELKNNIPSPDTEVYKRILDENFEETYYALTQLERREFWRSIIDHIVIRYKPKNRKHSDISRLEVHFL